MRAGLGAVVMAVAVAAAGASGGCRRERAAGASESAGGSGSAGASARAGADADAGGRAGAARITAREAMAMAKVSAIGFAAVGRDRDVVVDGTGIADRERKLAASAATIFEAASIAKLVVATCVMQMVEAGALDLDADVGRYVGFAVRHPRAPSPITLRMLLTHRGSLRDRNSELTARAADNPLGPFLERYVLRDGKPRAEAFLEAAPGAEEAYSNVGSALAALAVERVAREDFASLSTRRVLAPLRMSATAWRAPADASPLAAKPYAYKDGRFAPLRAASHAVYPAVDLHASAADLARFVRAILREGELDGARILSPASVRAMLGGEGDQALGWQLRSIGGSRVAGHEGEDDGATTALFLDVAAGAGAVVLANGDAFASGDKARAAAVGALVAELLAAAR